MCAGLVDPGTLAVHDFRRLALDSQAPLATFLDVVTRATAGLAEQPRRWAVAIPGPFDYATGVGGTHPSGKLRSLAGRDVDALLRDALGAETVTFCNDALAFGLGAAADEGVRRVLALTFGSGIGSAFVEDGRPASDDVRVPAGGEVYALSTSSGLTLEGRFGPAALARAYGCATFADLAALARTDPAILTTLRADFVGLADALAPWLVRFAPEVIVCGGGVIRAWDLFGEAFAERLTAHQPALVGVRHVVETELLAMRGAVAYSTGRPARSGGQVE